MSTGTRASTRYIARALVALFSVLPTAGVRCLGRGLGQHIFSGAPGTSGIFVLQTRQPQTTQPQTTLMLSAEQAPGGLGPSAAAAPQQDSTQPLPVSLWGSTPRGTVGELHQVGGNSLPDSLNRPPYLA